MWKEFSMNGNYKWLNLLDKIEYNSSYHRTIKRRPIDVDFTNEQDLLNTVYNNRRDYFFKQNVKFKVGDPIRLSKYKHVLRNHIHRTGRLKYFELEKYRRIQSQ